MSNTLITSRDKKGRRIAELTDVALNSAELTDEEAQRVIEDGGGFQADLVVMLRARANSFVSPLTDAELVSRYPEYEELVLKYRRFVANVFNVTNDRPIVRRLYPGFTLKVNAPKVGPCSGNFNYLQDWPFKDTPTPDALVWGVPEIVPESTNKSVKDQLAQLADLRRKFELPAGHLANLGSVGLNAALLLEEFKRTGVCQPLNHFAIRTDSLPADGHRLNLHWDDDGRLDCRNWGDVFLYGSLGCLALGIQILGR